MSEQRLWLENNEKYLGAALQWLRLRLEGARIPETPAATLESAQSPGGSSWFRRKQPAPQLKALPPVREPVNAKDLERSVTAMANAEAVDPPPALTILTRRFGLSRFERDVLLLCAAVEMDTRIAPLCALAQHQPHCPYPTFALALGLFDEPAWDVLSPERPLRYWRLLEISQPGSQPLTTSPLRCDERIVNYLKGLNYLDDRLMPLLVPFDQPAIKEELPPTQRAAVDDALHQLRVASKSGPPPLTQLVGPDPLSKQLVAQKMAAGLGLHLNRLPVESLPSQAGELETMARLWGRDSILLPVALYLDAHEVESVERREGDTHAVTPLLRRFLARGQGLFFLSTRETRSDLGSAHVVEVRKPVPAEQRDAWAQALENGAGDSPSLLAGQFNLNVSTIRQIAAVARVETESTGGNLNEGVWQACLIATRPSLDRLAQRLDAKATWEDIVLPEADMSLLRRLADQVAQRSTVYDTWGFRQKMNRGFGINALFAGESGTGKTMAAEVIANHLHLNLYRIDLSAVVSKYIGETEKNLRRLFDAAEDGGAILFFDEADALFGKRSEVKDSHDRYANIEINYLLQRIEAYNGLAILATNMKNALDQAFTRRLRFIITFPFPVGRERERIWRKSWPPEAPTEGLDYRHLARLNLTGGSITNIAVNAAFMAAQTGSPVTMPLVLEAARTEFRKLERTVNEADFRWQKAEAVVG